MAVEKHSKTRIESASQLWNICDDLRKTAEQISSLTKIRLEDEDTHPLGDTVILRFSKITADLDRASLDLKLGLDTNERIMLMKNLRDAIDGSPSKTSAIADAVAAEDLHIIEYIDGMEKSILSVIEDAYKFAKIHPTAAVEVGQRLTSLSEALKGEAEDIDYMIHPPQDYGGYHGYDDGEEP